MNEQYLIGVESPNLQKRSRRHRGDHSTACKCYPSYFAPDSFKDMPGELGRAMRKAVVKDKATGQKRLRYRLSRHPYFVQHREKAGRVRDFRPEKQALIDAFGLLLLQRGNVATGIVRKSVTELANELSPKDACGKVIPETRVEPSRISRLLEEWEAYGLIERPQKEWDPVEQNWMPRHVILTDRFYGGLFNMNMDEFFKLRNSRLAADSDGVIEPGTTASLKRAREKELDKIRLEALIYRRQKASQAKRKKRLSRLHVDDRRLEVAAWLIKTLPNHVKYRMTDNEFNALVWDHLKQMDLGLGVEPLPPDRLH